MALLPLASSFQCIQTSFKSLSVKPQKRPMRECSTPNTMTLFSTLLRPLKGEGQSHGKLLGDLGHPGLPLELPHFVLCFHEEITSLAAVVSHDNGL